MNFKDTLFAYVKFAFDNEARLLADLFPNLEKGVTYGEMDDFYMTGSIISSSVEILSGNTLDFRTQYINTQDYLDWVESKGGLPNE